MASGVKAHMRCEHGVAAERELAWSWHSEAFVGSMANNAAR